MEIKVYCACGAKYKFDVEPVNGRVPTPVNCPVCGVNGTAQANEIIRQTLGITTSAPTVAPPSEIAPPPPGIPFVASQTAAAPASGGLRITRLATAAPRESAAPPEPMQVDEPAEPRPGASPRPARARSPVFEKLRTAATVVLILAGLGLGVWKFGRKWYKRVSAVVDVAQVFGESSADSGSAGDNWNFSFEDCVVLFVRHTNHTQVAQACMDYWKTTLHRPLTIVPDAEEGVGGGQFELWPEHKGYVEFWGDLEWPQPEYEGLARHLSQRFGTLVFEARDVDFSGAYHFGVYDQGTRRFHAQMDIKIADGDIDEIVTTEGNEWALANGYKPGPEGFKEFDLGDGDKIAQRLGLRTWSDRADGSLEPIHLQEPRAKQRSN